MFARNSRRPLLSVHTRAETIQGSQRDETAILKNLVAGRYVRLLDSLLRGLALLIGKVQFSIEDFDLLTIFWFANVQSCLQL